MVHDNYYFTKAELDPSSLPLLRGLIQAFEWSFRLHNGVLTMTISKGKILSNDSSLEMNLTPLERNPCISAAIVRIMHKNWVRITRELPVNLMDDSEKLSVNSALDPTQLARLGPGSPPVRPKDIVSASPLAEVRPYDQSLPPEPMLIEPPIDIGHGVKNKENAEDFSRLRKKVLPIGTQDDLLQPYKPLPASPSHSSKPDFLTSAVAEVGLERFPAYALDFLRFYYKL